MPESPSDSAGAGDDDAVQLVGDVYRPLLQHLEAECREVLAAAAAEAAKVRSDAQDEARRILTAAHRERSAVLRRASSKQASMYEEAETEVERWLEELDEERQSLLQTAHDDADRILRAAAQQADIDSLARLEAADREAQALVAEARLEAARCRSSSPIQLNGVTRLAEPSSVMPVAPDTTEPVPSSSTPSQGSPPASAVTAPAADFVDADGEGTQLPHDPPQEIQELEPTLPAESVTPSAGADLEVEVVPGYAGTSAETEDAWSEEVFGTIASRSIMSEDTASMWDEVAFGSDAPLAQSPPVPETPSSGANGATVGGAPLDESLSRRERRHRRRFGLGKSRS